MKLILENWHQFLNEKLMLKPDDPDDPDPRGWGLYAQLVADAYLAAPIYEQRALSSFEALIPFIEKMFKRIQSRVDVEFVDYHPYESAQELRQDIAATGTMKIATIDSESEIFDEIINPKWRAVHDYMSHVQAIGSRGTEFTLRGELAAYNTHVKTTPREAIPALFTEVVGQVCTYNVLGKFAEQKTCLLDGFDYYNVGVVEGYDIINKELVKK